MAACGCVKPARISRRSSLLISLGDLGTNAAILLANASGRATARLPAVAVMEAPANSSSCNRRRSGVKRASTSHAAAPLTTATATNRTINGIRRLGSTAIRSVIDLDQPADDEGTEGLEDNRGGNHADSRRVRPHDVHRPGIQECQES